MVNTDGIIGRDFLRAFNVNVYFGSDMLTIGYHSLRICNNEGEIDCLITQEKVNSNKSYNFIDIDRLQCCSSSSCNQIGKSFTSEFSAVKANNEAKCNIEHPSFSSDISAVKANDEVKTNIGLGSQQLVQCSSDIGAVKAIAEVKRSRNSYRGIGVDNSELNSSAVKASNSGNSINFNTDNRNSAKCDDTFVVKPVEFSKATYAAKVKVNEDLVIPPRCEINYYWKTDENIVGEYILLESDEKIANGIMIANTLVRNGKLFHLG